MSLLKAYLLKASTQRTLSRKPGEKGFSLIELVVVIAVLAVLTAIALPNFLGVSDDASARSAQQAVLNAYKECRVFWARNKRDGVGTGQREFVVPSVTDWAIVATTANATANLGFASGITAAGGANAVSQPATTTPPVACFEANEDNRDFYAVPKSQVKFPTYKVSADGGRYCLAGSGSTQYPDTFNVGCSSPNNSTPGEWE